jgi:type II secretory pathway component HofQ
MKTHNLTPLVRWACRLSAVAVVVLAVTGMSCSTNGEADTGDTPTKAAPPGKPLVVRAWLVEANGPLFSATPEAVASAARGDLTGLFPDSGGQGLDSILRSLEEQGLAMILQAPVMFTRTGEGFSARSGLQIPVQTTVQGGLAVQYVDATVRFEGVVAAGADGLLEVDVTFKKQIPRYDLVKGDDPNSPIQTTDSSLKLVVESGGTAVASGTKVISGLFATDRRDARVSVPGELVLFVTPTLVDS